MSVLDSSHARVPGAQFAPTHWTVVLTASGHDSAAREALENLCRHYWPPLYAYVRRQGHSPHDAQDLTQEFFRRLLEKNYLADVDRSKGKFRSFLLASLQHFLANERDKQHAQKRGGGAVPISIDAGTAESGYQLELGHDATAEKIFERRWAITLLAQVLARLEAEYQADDKGDLFARLKDTLTGESGRLPYAEIAARLGTSEGAVKVAVHRLRQRYRELLRLEIAGTVATAAEIDGEMRHLFQALSR